MPEYSPDGRTWTIRLKPGVRFADDPAFNGRKREVTAADVVYSWKRLVDPRIRSPNADLIRGKLVGIDAAAEKAKATGRFDYDTDIEGLRAVDRHTLQLKLIEPDYTLLSYLNSSALRVVAREVIERYADENGRAMDHPVGSNAYRLKEWLRGQKVVLEANPNFREVGFPAAPRGCRCRDEGDRRGDGGQAPAADRHDRDIDRRGRQSSPPDVHARASSTSSTCRARSRRA